MYLQDPIERRYTCYRRITPSALLEALDLKSVENLLLSQIPAKILVTTDAIELSQLLQADDSLPNNIPNGQIPNDKLLVSLEGISSTADDPLLLQHENDPLPTTLVDDDDDLSFNPTSQSTSQPASQPASQPISQPASQPTSQPTSDFSLPLVTIAA